MGVKSLNKFLASCKEECKFDDFIFQILPVDASSTVYRFAIAIRSKGKDMENNYGQITSHLYAMIKNTIFLYRNGIKPIYVFDGSAPLQKQQTNLNRSKTREDATEKYINCTDQTSDVYTKNFKKSYVLTRRQNIQCQEILEYMGIPYVQSIGESDAQIAALACLKNVYAAIAEDNDILLFGAPVQLKNFSGKNKYVYQISMHNVLKYMKKLANEIRELENLEPIEKITHVHLIEFAILLGCDYTFHHIRGISAEAIYKIFAINNMDIKKTLDAMYRNIEELKQNGKEYYIVPDNFIDECMEAKEIYLNANVIDPNKINMVLNKPNRKKIMELMCEKNNFNRKKISNFIDELDEIYEILSNNAIDKFKNYQYTHNIMYSNKDKDKDKD
jgi:flap endonuclease-1